MVVRILDGDTERIEAVMLDGSLAPITGLATVLLSIRRVSDGFWYDFDDDTFKTSGWTTRQQAMTETDSTNDQGQYHYDFNTSSITNASVDDTYMIRVDQVAAANVPQFGELKIDQWLKDNFDEHDATQTAVVGVQSDTDDIQTRLPAALVGGRMDSDVAIIQASQLAAINTQLEVTSGHGAGAWTSGVGVTQQNVRDAMKLAPTVGAPAAGSVDEHLDEINTDTASVDLRLPSDPADESLQQASHTQTQADISVLKNLSQADVQSAMTAQGYTVARAAKLDFLDVAISTVVTNIGALNDLSQADVQTAMTGQGYTVARAALIDNLDAAISSIVTVIAALNDIDIADVQTAMSNQGYTAGRASNLDNLDATISSIALAIAGLNDLNATQVENAVWDAVASGHIASGSMGLLLNNAGADSPEMMATKIDEVWQRLGLDASNPLTIKKTDHEADGWKITHTTIGDRIVVQREDV